MRLFISYARVDKPYCIQIVDTLDVHDSWFDQRLYAGQKWWDEILRRLDWCQAFVYLLSSDSIASEYCMREYELARSLGRPIIPVLIEEGITLPASLAEVQYVDFSREVTPEAVKDLLNATYVAERDTRQQENRTVAAMPTSETRPPAPDAAVIISSVAAAMENGQFDRAVFLLRQAQSNNFHSEYIDVNALLQEALAGLERQSYLREADRNYRQIAALINVSATRRLGCQAFLAFHQAFPDYDPDNLLERCEENGSTGRFALPNPLRKLVPEPEPQVSFTLPMLEWCDVEAGRVYVGDVNKNGSTVEWIDVPAFQISKYPVTNAQYQAFLDDPEGYANPRWWEFSEHAKQWREENQEPKTSQFKSNEHPREMISWYDSMAFACWLSSKLGAQVSLPTVNQWMRAARGDKDYPFPWGDRFYKENCNTSECKVKMTSMVTRYPDGASPFGVMDMAGNVWEWCLNPKHDDGDEPDIKEAVERAVHGGSYIGPSHRAKISFRYYLKPRLYYSSIGFRLVKRS